ncbi:MAG TPA: SAM-dependent methyltransferase, partial [Erysipelothrix sp.]|nr:SAM-dependent methyltransferase [Erysipelothrix sp.]
MISCPICQQPLVLAEKEAYCAQNHRFDRARQGYY